MSIILRLLVVMLTSIITNGVYAQTSKTISASELSTDDIAQIEQKIAQSDKLSAEDSAVVVSLLRQNNIPITNVITEELEFVPEAKPGDKRTAFISGDKWNYWLSYVIYRDTTFIGRIDNRLD